MARLKALTSQLPILAPSRVRQMPYEESRRDMHWRSWYGTAKWKALRWSVLVRDKFQCKLCRKVEIDTSLLVADHVVAHRGEARLFWDRSNLQTLCKTCHDTAKQSEEKNAAQF